MPGRWHIALWRACRVDHRVHMFSRMTFVFRVGRISTNPPRRVVCVERESLYYAKVEFSFMSFGHGRATILGMEPLRRLMACSQAPRIYCIRRIQLELTLVHASPCINFSICCPSRVLIKTSCACILKVSNVDNANVYVFCMQCSGKGTCASADNRLDWSSSQCPVFNRLLIKQGSLAWTWVSVIVTDLTANWRLKVGKIKILNVTALQINNQNFVPFKVHIKHITFFYSTLSSDIFIVKFANKEFYCSEQRA